MTIDPVIAIATVALTLSVLTFLFQFILVRPARVKFAERGASRNTLHASPLFTYEDLPQEVKDEFPRLRLTKPLYAILDLPFVNTGSRTGILRIDERKTRILDSTTHTPVIEGQKGGFRYVLVLPNSVTMVRMILHDLPTITTPTTYDIVINAKWSGVTWWLGKFKYRSLAQEPIRFELEPLSTKSP
jgi:hypothetical protein